MPSGQRPYSASPAASCRPPCAGWVLCELWYCSCVVSRLVCWRRLRCSPLGVGGLVGVPLLLWWRVLRRCACCRLLPHLPWWPEPVGVELSVGGSGGCCGGRLAALWSCWVRWLASTAAAARSSPIGYVWAVALHRLQGLHQGGSGLLLWHAETSVFKPRPTASPTDQTPEPANQVGRQAAGPLPPPQQPQQGHQHTEEGGPSTCQQAEASTANEQPPAHQQAPQPLAHWRPQAAETDTTLSDTSSSSTDPSGDGGVAPSPLRRTRHGGHPPLGH